MKNLIFKDPKKCDFLLYDQENGRVILEEILKGREVETLYVRFEKLFLGPKVLFQMLLNLKYFEFWVFRHNKLTSFPKTILGRFYKIYLLSFIKVVSPKIIITYIDDDHGFSWLTHRYKKAEFFAIQNGVRDKNCIGKFLPPAPLPGSQISLTHFFCFGSHEKDIYGELGHKVERFIPVGSLKASIFREKILKENEHPDFDVCTVSCWDENVMIHNKTRPSFKIGMTRQHKYLAYAAKLLNLKVCIALRGSSRLEREFFESIYGKDVFYQAFDEKKYSTYTAMSRSKVTTATLSTTLREHFGFGKKVLFCNFTEDETYDFPVQGFWSFTKLDKDQFVEHLKSLLEMPELTYTEKTKSAREYIMNYRSVPTHLLIKEEIERFL
ncbi:hypothetical protein OAK75_00300 [Bacteriovoracales bacterium]|nr:hypothetical protein [Bacteriovoracales bacterium]